MSALIRLYTTHSRSFKAAVSLFLLGLVLVASCLLVVVFTQPTLLHLDTLLYVAEGHSGRVRLTPAVAVAVLSAALTGATIALVTRCVDESLWCQLTPRDNKARLTVAESRNLAQWSISAAARVRYLVFGRSWALKLGGLLILGFVAVNPVLLSGISQKVDSTKVTTFRPKAADTGPWAGFLDDVNTWRASGRTRDLLGETAFLASLRSLNAPAADVCSDDLCTVNARMVGYQASCTSASQPNPNRMGRYPIGDQDLASQTFCSAQQPDVCVDLQRGNPATAANFTNSMPAPADGYFTTIFGAYLHDWSNINTVDTIYTVDCEVRFGFVNITQTGSNPPAVLRSSFQVVPSDELERNVNFLGRIYGGDMASQSPWVFLGGNYGAGGEQIMEYPVGTALLGWRDTFDGPTVASRIEHAWDMNNVFAFGRSSNIVDMATTIETRRTLYVYRKLVLLVLLIPAMATVLGVWGRWRVSGDDVMMGYDPVRIAGCGPVYGIVPGTCQEDLDGMMVARYTQAGMDANGTEMRYYQFIAHGVAPQPGQQHQQQLETPVSIVPGGSWKTDG